MAEAIVNARLQDSWIAFSAGTKPAEFTHPLALQVLSEIGIIHDGVSKSVNQFRDLEFDLVITVCDSAFEECPIWLGKGKRVHMGFPDPAKASGTDEEILTIFRQVRDSLSDRIIPFLTNQIASKEDF